MSDPKNAIGEALSLPKLKMGQTDKERDIRPDNPTLAAEY